MVVMINKARSRSRAYSFMECGVSFIRGSFIASLLALVVFLYENEI